MTQKIINALLALGMVLALVGVVMLMHQGPQSLGAAAYNALPTWFGNGLSAGSSQQLAVDSSGNLSITNASATSTLAAGCMQLNATSSATNVKLVLSTLGATSTFKGTAYWTYGTCP